MQGGTQKLSGVHVVREALRARRRDLRRLHLAGPLRGPARELLALAQAAGVEVRETDRAALEELLPGRPPQGGGPEGARGNDRSQGVVLEAGPLPELDLTGLLALPGEERRVVALDGVEDPQNVGAVARVAEGAGADALLIPRHRSAPLSPAASRASAGALEHLPVCRVPNLAKALAGLKAGSFWSIGADAEGEADLYTAPDRVFEGDLVVVMGSEGRGIRPGVGRQLDHRVRIPMYGQVASLNVATATAVVLFELARRRG